MKFNNMKEAVQSFIQSIELQPINEISKLAKRIEITQAALTIAGSWSEETAVNLIDPIGNILYQDAIESLGFKGTIKQIYSKDSLFRVAHAVLYGDATYDHYLLEPGSMKLIENGLDADDTLLLSNNNSRQVTDHDGTELYEGDDFYDTEFTKSPVETQLVYADLVATELELTLSTGEEVVFSLTSEFQKPKLILFLYLALVNSSRIAYKKGSDTNLQDLFDSFIYNYFSDNDQKYLQAI